MKRLANILSGFWQLLARIICAAAAVLFLQIPVYMDQYTGILVQAREEARPVFEATQRRAFQRNFSPEAYLDALELEVSNSDSLEMIRSTFGRYNEYDQKIAAITQASTWKKPLVFMQQSEKRVREAMEFEPGFNYDTESLTYGLLGVLLCSFFLSLLTWPFRRMARRRKSSH